jgi:hypothetical protein
MNNLAVVCQTHATELYKLPLFMNDPFDPASVKPLILLFIVTDRILE